MIKENDKGLEQLANAIKHWKYIQAIAYSPQNEAEFDKLVLILDALLNEVKGDEKHQLMGLVDLVTHYVSEYEKQHYAEPMANVS